jgi:hypothetical protein
MVTRPPSTAQSGRTAVMRGVVVADLMTFVERRFRRDGVEVSG